MKEKTLLKIALTCSFAGIIILYIVSNNITIEESSIAKINDEEIGAMVKLKGTIDRFFQGNKTAIIRVKHPESIDVVVLDRLQANLTIGDYIEVIGEIEEYKGKREIIAHRIRVVE